MEEAAFNSDNKLAKKVMLEVHRGAPCRRGNARSIES
jgi:hypothetical protein